MFSSLRSRLWLTYALTIIAALLVVAVIFVVYLLDNPLVYRQTRLRLAAVEETMLATQAGWSNLSTAQLQPMLAAQAQELNVRLLVVSPKRKVLVDSQIAGDAVLEIQPLYRLFRLNQILIDAKGRAWLYVTRKLDNGNLLVAAVLRPKVSLWNIFTDELVPPLLWGGALALVLALFIAFGMARWVADPLQGLVNAAQEFSGGEAQPLALKGPREVQELVGAFNRMTARVQSSQQAQREFVANVSHELKTPLTSVQGFSQAILDGTASTPEQQKQAAQVIFSESERMHRMVLDLLDLARLDAGIADLKRAPVDLAALLNSVAERFEPQARRAGIALEIHGTNLPALTGDGDRLAQVFNNLIDNALKFTPAGGKVSVYAVSVGDAVEVTVQDTGAGIPPEAQPRIFDRFYQADVSRQGGQKHGAGLGLAIVREIIRAHGGKISVRSVVGQGSEFVVRLPLVNPDASTIVRKNRRL
jgi:signal transduction histidine kinase